MTAEELFVIEAVKRQIGEDAYKAFEPRWCRAVVEDLRALRKCVRDLEERRGGVHNPAGWLWGAYRREHDGHLALQAGRSAR